VSHVLIKGESLMKNCESGTSHPSKTRVALGALTLGIVSHPIPQGKKEILATLNTWARAMQSRQSKGKDKSLFA